MQHQFHPKIKPIHISWLLFQTEIQCTTKQMLILQHNWLLFMVKIN